LFFKRNGNGAFPSQLPDIPIWSRDHARTLTLQDTGVFVDGTRSIALRRCGWRT
jgi:hypothetical protein